MNLIINNTKISKVSSCKYLGVHIDEFLSWDVHIEYIYKKLIKFTSLFYKVRNILPTACLHKLYFAFVHPHILYGIEVYANTCKTKLDKLMKLNNKLIRILLNKKWLTPVKELYIELDVLPIPLLHEMKILDLIHKCLYEKQLVPDVFRNYFIEKNSVHSHNTRRGKNLFLRSVSSNFGKRNTAFHGSKTWNCLPENFKLCSSNILFKKLIKKYLMDRIC